MGYTAAPELRIEAVESHDQQLFATTNSGGGQREEGQARLSQVIASQLDNLTDELPVGEMFFIDISTVSAGSTRPVYSAPVAGSTTRMT